MLESKPEKKQYILKYMRESLESIVQKEALSYTFVHNLLYEYLKYADDIERQVRTNHPVAPKKRKKKDNSVI